MFRKVFSFFCLVSFVGTLHATVQIKDSIKLVDPQNKTVLESRIQEAPLQKILLEKKVESNSSFLSTANYSGYTADWLVKDGKLYLENYYSGYENLNSETIKANSRLKQLFPESDGPVFAAWCTGTLHFGEGKERMVARLGHLVLYDYLHVYEIENGTVQSKKTYKYPEGLEYYKEKFKKEGRSLTLKNE